MPDSFDPSLYNSIWWISQEDFKKTELILRQKELVARQNIWDLVEKIAKLSEEEKLDDNFYPLLLAFWQSMVDLWILINMCTLNIRVENILEKNFSEKIITNLDNEPISDIIYPNLVERLWVEITILEQKHGINMFILWQSIFFIRKEYNNMSWVSIEELWNRIIETINIIKELEAKLKEKNDELKLCIWR